MQSLQDKIRLSKEFPIELHIDVTNHCDMGCSICPMRDRYTKNIMPLGYMSMELFNRIVSECAVHNREGTKIELSLHKDGEPLMHPHIGDMIKIAKDFGMFVHFATNGLLLKKKKKEILDSGLDLLTISYTSNRQFLSISKFMDAKNGQKPLTQLKVYPGLKSDLELPSCDKIIRGKVHSWTHPIEAGRTKPCPKLLYNPAITWDGLLTVCCVDYKREGVLGDVTKTSIKELWQGARELYEQQAKGVFNDPCKHCNYWEQSHE